MCTSSAVTVVSRVLRAALGLGEADVVVQNAAATPCRIGTTSLGALAAAALDLPGRLAVLASGAAADDRPTLAAGGRSLLRFVVDDLGAGPGGLCPVQLLPASHRAPLGAAVPALGTTGTCLSVPALPAVPGLPPLPGLSPAPPPTAVPSAPPARYRAGTTGYDVSWPQCGSPYPPSAPVAVVGVNDGRAFTTNPCLASEASWAGSSLDTYMNLNSPAAVSAADDTGPAGTCPARDGTCLAYDDGYNAARQALQLAATDGLHPRMWWLDIETVGRCGSFPTAGDAYWSCNRSLNARTIQGALDALRASGAEAAISSTSYQWSQITGGVSPGGPAVPNWLAGDTTSPPSSWCSGTHDFAGGPAWLLQLWPAHAYDRDQAC